MRCPAARVVLLAIAFALAGSGCGRDAPERTASAQGAPPAPEAAGASPTLAPGTWRGTLALPGGELPFGLEVVSQGAEVVLFIENGAERVRVDDVRIHGGRLEARMPGYVNRLTATIEARRLQGEFVLVRRGGEEQRIPFAATHGHAHRFFEAPLTDNADVSGRWAVVFTDRDGKETSGVAEFAQAHAKVTGTFLLPTGDHRFLAGEMRDDVLHLSGFDGGHAFLYRARLGTDGALSGTFWSGLHWQEQFVARRDGDADLGDAARVTALRPDAGRLDFTFPDLDGRPVSLSDDRFRGKVVVIVLAGSWCANCHDEAAFLAPWHQQNRARGLEVIALMFEHFGDFERAAQATRHFREAFGIEYTTLIAGTSDKQDAASRLPQLNGVHAFPTTIFVDRQGRVRHIHAGFAGPATGARHQALVEEFDGVLEQLLSEQGEAERVRPSGT